jgi:tetratricopeptide (TPR) repeat protein/tRNA A-37 threonylcarbamoyl transferase component Bud32
MSPDAKRCPDCGAPQPATAPEGLCPSCLMRPTTTGVTPGPAEADATRALAATRSGQAPEPTPGDAEATVAHITGPVASTAPVPHDTTHDWTPDSNLRTRTYDGHEVTSALPHGTSVRYFGDYEVQKELGRGGMGVVYKARQVSLNRPVALKMIKAGALADDAELRRFRNEAEAVALLDHAGIVPVYEVGEHDGQNYFSMKLVEGGNLADQLLTFQANPRAAATLLAETAEAVHHAHMRGILHRDLKPANILVDAEGHPHVTDFGLAKVIESDIELTQTGAIMGTPAYMSPEQANGRRGTITTATDVYGLGAILYALLTAKAPFRGDSVMETLDAVRTCLPEPPKSLNAGTPRDLETICLKCLEKDPRRRYASAQALADDLHAWLESRPISARRVGAAERAWLWCGRKPVVAALAAAVLLAVVAGTAAVIVVQTRANRALAKQNRALESTNINLAEQRRRADGQRSRAETRETQAIEAVKRFGDAVANERELKNNPALEVLRKRLLKEPLAFLKDLRSRLQAEHDTNPDSLTRLAFACESLGRLTNQIGDKEDALVAYWEALVIWQRLTDADPSVAWRRRALAGAHESIGNLLKEIGRGAEALKSFEAGLEVRRKLADANPTEIDFQRDLSASHGNIGTLLEHINPTVSLKEHRLSLEIIRKVAEAKPTETNFQVCLATEYMNVGVLLRDTGEPAEALKAFESALVIYQKLIDANPSEPTFQNSQGLTYNNMGILLMNTGKLAEALKTFKSALAIRGPLAAANPTVTEYQENLAAIHYNIGICLSQNGKPADARSAYQEALAIRERQAREHPEVPDHASNAGATLNNLVLLDWNEGRLSDGRARIRQAVAWQRKALAMNPANPTYRQFMTHHLANLSELARRLGRTDESAKAASALVEMRGGVSRRAALDERLNALLAADPADANVERLDRARKAHEKGLHAAASGLWAEALKADPKLASDRQAQHRYNAACAAALAGSAASKDDPPPDEAAKVKLRKQAHDWLEAELAVWSKLLESAKAEQRAAIAQTLQHWQEDTDLTSIRDPKAIDDLTETEREGWRTLWKKVAETLARAKDPSAGGK